jgi:catechol 2,3-dioxygenase
VGEGDTRRLRTMLPRAEGRSSLFGPIDPGVRIGHVHLKAADLDRALDFDCGVLGIVLMQRYGAGGAFVTAAGYHPQ